MLVLTFWFPVSSTHQVCFMGGPFLMLVLTFWFPVSSIHSTPPPLLSVRLQCFCWGKDGLTF